MGTALYIHQSQQTHTKLCCVVLHCIVCLQWVTCLPNDADHPPPPRAGLQMDWSYNSTSPLCLHRQIMECPLSLHIKTT